MSKFLHLAHFQRLEALTNSKLPISLLQLLLAQVAPWCQLLPFKIRRKKSLMLAFQRRTFKTGWCLEVRSRKMVKERHCPGVTYHLSRTDTRDVKMFCNSILAMVTWFHKYPRNLWTVLFEGANFMAWELDPSDSAVRMKGTRRACKCPAHVVGSQI